MTSSLPFSWQPAAPPAVIAATLLLFVRFPSRTEEAGVFGTVFIFDVQFFSGDSSAACDCVTAASPMVAQQVVQDKTDLVVL